MTDPEAVATTREVYNEKPVLLIEDGMGAVLYGMTEYLAGNGNPPAVGDELVLSVLGPPSHSFDHITRRRIDHPRSVYLEGVYQVVEATHGDIASPFFKKTEGEAVIWGINVKKIRDITTEEEIDRTEKANLVSMI